MLHTHKRVYDRSLEKRRERVFINSLRKEFELSPAESQGELELAQRCPFGEAPSKLGQIRFICASIKAQYGKSLKDHGWIKVRIPVHNN